MRETPIWRRYVRLLRNNSAADVEDEIAFHLSKRVEDLVARGHSEADARAQATREFGSVERVRRELQAIGRRRRQRERRAHWWESLSQDVRFGVRTLRKSPGFVAVVVATLALGIGGTTAVFSVVEAVLLAPLPYEASGQLVRFYQQEPDVASSRTEVTGPHFKEIRNQAALFEDVAAFNETNGLDLVADGQAQRLRVLAVTSGYFRTLRSGALRGRGFQRDDEVGAPRVILSDALWRSRFDGDPSLIGATVHLSAEPHVVVGIAPQGFEDPIVGKVDVWLPYDLAGNTNEEDYTLSAVGRLRNGVSFDQARAEIAALTQSLAERWPVRASTLVVRPLKEDLVAPSRRTLHLLFIAVGLVLLVACVNVANLSLVRATGRTRELAIRAALGSGGLRIARQLLVENLLLAAAGGLLGLALTVAGIHVLRALGGDAIPRLAEVALDPAALVFATLVTLATAVGVGVMPAIRSAHIAPSRALGEHSRSTTGARRLARLRSALAAGQLALALTLLVGATVLMVSFHRLQRVDLGFRIARVLSFDLSLPGVRYDAERRAAFHEELARALERIPGVTAAGGTSHLPATGTYHSWPVRIDSGPLAGTVPKMRSASGDQQTEQRVVSGNFFAAADIPVLAGRTFGVEDDTRVPARAVVSADFAQQAFPNMSLDNVVGERIAIFSQELEIIGVVGRVALNAYGAPGPVVYRAHHQNADDRNWALTEVVATKVPPERILGAVRAEVAALDPQLVVHRAAPMTEVVGRGVGRERFTLVLMAGFAAVALLLAALGLYGVLADTVRQRTPEIGIRIALGATAVHVRALVLRQAAVVVGIGLVVGIAGAVALGRALSALLFQTSSSDPRVFVATALVLSVVAFLAAWLPACRASRVAPRVAMQNE